MQHCALVKVLNPRLEAANIHLRHKIGSSICWMSEQLKHCKMSEVGSCCPADELQAEC